MTFCYLKNTTKGLVTIKNPVQTIVLKSGDKIGLDHNTYLALEKEIKAFSIPGVIKMSFGDQVFKKNKEEVKLVEKKEKISLTEKIVSLNEASQKVSLNETEEVKAPAKKKLKKSKK